jgi:hypothetical protein
LLKLIYKIFLDFFQGMFLMELQRKSLRHFTYSTIVCLLNTMFAIFSWSCNSNWNFLDFRTCSTPSSCYITTSNSIHFLNVNASLIKTLKYETCIHIFFNSLVIFFFLCMCVCVMKSLVEWSVRRHIRAIYTTRMRCILYITVS